MTQTTAREHLDWCVERAMQYYNAGDHTNAITSFLSDVGKHDGTAWIQSDKLAMPLLLLEVGRGSVAFRGGGVVTTTAVRPSRVWRLPADVRDSQPRRWQVQFSRVGRHYGVPPLDLPDAPLDELEAAIQAYAWQGLASASVTVVVDLPNRRGYIRCGAHNGGSFRLADHPDHFEGGQS